MSRDDLLLSGKKEAIAIDLLALFRIYTLVHHHLLLPPIYLKSIFRVLHSFASIVEVEILFILAYFDSSMLCNSLYC